MLITYISGYDIRRWCRMNSNDDSAVVYVRSYVHQMLSIVMDDFCA